MTLYFACTITWNYIFEIIFDHIIISKICITSEFCQKINKISASLLHTYICRYFLYETQVSYACVRLGEVRKINLHVTFSIIERCRIEDTYVYISLHWIDETNNMLLEKREIDVFYVLSDVINTTWITSTWNMMGEGINKVPTLSFWNSLELLNMLH